MKYCMRNMLARRHAFDRPIPAWHFSCITNLATGIAGGAHSLEEVYKKAGEAAENMSELVTEALPQLT